MYRRSWWRRRRRRREPRRGRCRRFGLIRSSSSGGDGGAICLLWPQGGGGSGTFRRVSTRGAATTVGELHSGHRRGLDHSGPHRRSLRIRRRRRRRSASPSETPALVPPGVAFGFQLAHALAHQQLFERPLLDGAFLFELEFGDVRDGALQRQALVGGGGGRCGVQGRAGFVSWSCSGGVGVGVGGTGDGSRRGGSGGRSGADFGGQEGCEGVDACRDGLSPPPFDLFVVEFPGLFPLVCPHCESFVAPGPAASACPGCGCGTASRSSRGGRGRGVWRGNGEGVLLVLLVVLMGSDEGLRGCRHLGEDLGYLLVIARRHGRHVHAVECSGGG